MLCPGGHQALVLGAVGYQFSRGGTWLGVCCAKLTVGLGQGRWEQADQQGGCPSVPKWWTSQGGTETEPRTVRRPCRQEVTGRAVVVGTRRSPGLDHGLRCL